MNTERLVEANLYISEKRYLSRKDLFKNRIESVIEYVKDNKVCRSKMLLEYFGQEAKNNCGICDVCINKKNQQIIENRREEVAKHIIEILKVNGATKISEIETIAADEYTLYLKTLRDLIDNNLVIIKDDIIYMSKKL